MKQFLTILAFTFEIFLQCTRVGVYYNVHAFIFKDEYRLCHDAIAEYLLNDCVYGNC